MEHQEIIDKPKNVPYECVIAVYNNCVGISYTLLKSEPNIFDDNVFDGNDLEDNLTETKNFPKETGIYKCKILVHAYKYFNGDCTEYDVNVWMEDIEKIFNF